MRTPLALALLVTPALVAQAQPHPETSHMQPAMNGVLMELVGQYDKFCEAKVAPELIPSRLDAVLGQKTAANPFDASRKAIRPCIAMLEGFVDHLEARKIMEGLATIPGQTVFAIQLPIGKEPGFLLAAYRTHTPMEGHLVIHKCVNIE